MSCRASSPMRVVLAVVLTAASGLAAGQEPEAELHRAARAGDVASLKARLAQGVSPDAEDGDGRTALLDAVAAGRLDAMRLLLAAGAGANTPSRSGRTPLIEAAEHGQLAAARLLVKAGADLDRSQRGWGTAVEAAERTGHNAIAAMLRQAGARSSGRSPGDTVCVRPWNGNGYCGVVERVQKTVFRIRVTEIVGCEWGCAARAECSAGQEVGGRTGLREGDVVTTVSWCLTHTGVQP